MAFGFPAASVAAAAPFSSLLFSSRPANHRQSSLTYADTWLHARARESTRQFPFFLSVPFFLSASLLLHAARAFPSRIPPVGQPFPTTCTCSWNTRARATAACQRLSSLVLTVNASMVATMREFSSILRHVSRNVRVFRMLFTVTGVVLGRLS